MAGERRALVVDRARLLVELSRTTFVPRFAGGVRLFERASDSFRFLVIAAAPSAAVSATVGVSVLSLAGYAPSRPSLARPAPRARARLRPGVR